jgi:Tfp pilus assembly protein PilF
VTLPKPDILQGWKNIAEYLSRDVSTVKRWEKYRGLPVRRIPGDGRANVYAQASELTKWLASAEPESSGVDSDDTLPALEAPDKAVSAAVPSGMGVASPLTAAWRTGLLLAAGTLFLVTILFGIVRHHRSVATQHLRAAKDQAVTPVVPHDVEDLYLRGVFSYEKRTPESLQRAEQYLTEAANRSPNYAPALAGLSVTYDLMRQYGSMPSAEAYAKARFFAEKAIAVDPNVSDAHASLAFIYFFWDWKAAAAEKEFQTAITLDPNSALAHHWYGSMLTHEARFAEAVEQLDIAQRLAPNSTAILYSRAVVLGFDGHRQQAIDLLHQITEEDPEYPSTHGRIAILALTEPKNIQLFLDEKGISAKLGADNADVALNQAMTSAYRRQGEAAMWQVYLKAEQAKHPSERTMLMAAIEAELGDKDAAFADLERSANRHDLDVIGINIGPEFDSLHSDPRYGQLLKTVGLPPLR